MSWECGGRNERNGAAGRVASMQLASQGLRLAHISKKTVFIPSSLSAKLKNVNMGVILGYLVLARVVGG